MSSPSQPPSGIWGPPQRIRLRRIRGFSLQRESLACNGRAAVHCARPGRWGNPFRAERFGAAASVALFERMLRGARDFADLPPALHASARAAADDWAARWHGAPPLADLAGRNLACYCALDAPCHADVLLRAAATP